MYRSWFLLLLTCYTCDGRRRFPMKGNPVTTTPVSTGWTVKEIGRRRFPMPTVPMFATVISLATEETGRRLFPVKVEERTTALPGRRRFPMRTTVGFTPSTTVSAGAPITERVTLAVQNGTTALFSLADSSSDIPSTVSPADRKVSLQATLANTTLSPRPVSSVQRPITDVITILPREPSILTTPVLMTSTEHLRAEVQNETTKAVARPRPTVSVVTVSIRMPATGRQETMALLPSLTPGPVSSVHRSINRTNNATVSVRVSQMRVPPGREVNRSITATPMLTVSVQRPTIETEKTTAVSLPVPRGTTPLIEEKLSSVQPEPTVRSVVSFGGRQDVRANTTSALSSASSAQRPIGEKQTAIPLLKEVSLDVHQDTTTTPPVKLRPSAVPRPTLLALSSSPRVSASLTARPTIRPREDREKSIPPSQGPIRAMQSKERLVQKEQQKTTPDQTTTSRLPAKTTSVPAVTPAEEVVLSSEVATSRATTARFVPHYVSAITPPPKRASVTLPPAVNGQPSWVTLIKYVLLSIVVVSILFTTVSAIVMVITRFHAQKKPEICDAVVVQRESSV